MPLLNYEAYWGLFPLGIAIATMAMATGIDGAAFWAPVLLLWYEVDPPVAIACGIFIEVFGFTSGVYGYAKRGSILFREALPLLGCAVLFGLIGAYVSKVVPARLLLGAVGAGSLFLSYRNIRKIKRGDHEQRSEALHLKQKGVGCLLSGIGGFFTGTIGFGIGQTNNYYLLVRNRLSVPYASGTTVFMIAVTACVTSVFNFFYYEENKSVDVQQIYNIVFFAVPAAVIGAQAGVRLAHKIKGVLFYYGVAVIFFVIALLSFYRIIV
jgi:uncharacterized membrane protein YfcA